MNTDLLARVDELLTQRAKLKPRRAAKSDIVAMIQQVPEDDAGEIDADLVVKKPFKWNGVTYVKGNPFVFAAVQKARVLIMAEEGYFALADEAAVSDMNNSMKGFYEEVANLRAELQTTYRRLAEERGIKAAAELQAQQSASRVGIHESVAAQQEKRLEAMLADAVIMV